VRTRLAVIGVALSALVVLSAPRLAYGLLPVPDDAECPASRVTLTFEPAFGEGQPPHVAVSDARTKQRLAYADLTSATMSERCGPFTFENRPKNYRVKRKVRAAARIECSVRGAAVRIQIGDHGLPVNDASTSRTVVLSTAARDLALAMVGEGPFLTYDASACRSLS
jgi:hypothetical protein